MDLPTPSPSSRLNSSAVQPPRFLFEDGHLVPDLAGSGSSAKGWEDLLRQGFGTDDTQLINYLVRKTLLGTGKPRPGAEAEVNALASVFAEIQPRDALERLLLAQMLMAFSHASREFQLAAQASLPGEAERHLNLAVRLVRLYATQLESLRKYRNGGGQTITVNHVVANQAVVGGTISTRG